MKKMAIGCEEEQKKYVGSVDIVRFLMMLLIMCHHLYLLGYSENYPGYSCWAWVDYFFILTGFFTMRHFDGCEKKEDFAKEAMAYTIKKFKNYMPYVFVSVTIQYILAGLPYIRQHDLREAVKVFVNLPYEALLLSSSGIVWPKMSPIWFLSAMFLTLPLLIYMILRFRDLWKILSWLIPVLYYGKMGVNTLREWPNDLIRAFACMALGTFVYMMTQYMRKMKLSKMAKLILTLVETGSFCLCTYITVTNKDFMNLLILLFAVHAMILLSGCSFTGQIHGRGFKFLGELSFYMFIFHWVVGSIAAMLSSVSVVRLCIYFAGTIVVSGAAMWINYKVSGRMR